MNEKFEDEDEDEKENDDERGEDFNLQLSSSGGFRYK